jgi:hypothetical protein
MNLWDVEVLGYVFYVEIKWFSCLPSTQQRTTFTLSAIQNSRAPCKSEREREREREKFELVPFWTAGVRSLAGVFLLQTYSEKWLGRPIHCAFSQPEAFILWTLTFHWCIDRSMQILNERESRLCRSLTRTLQYTSSIKSNNITQCLRETPRYAGENM